MVLLQMDPRSGYIYQTPSQPSRASEAGDAGLREWVTALDELESLVGVPGPSTPAREREKALLEEDIARSAKQLAELRERLVAAQQRQVSQLDTPFGHCFRCLGGRSRPFGG